MSVFLGNSAYLINGMYPSGEPMAGQPLKIVE